MGCYPIGKKLSKVVTKCYGGDDNHLAYNMPYSPPSIYQTRTMTKTVTFSNNNSVYIIPNEPVQNPGIPETYMTQPEPTQAPPPQPEMPKPKDQVPVKGWVRHVHAPDPHVPNQPDQVPSRGGIRFVHGPHPPSVNRSLPMQGPHPPSVNTSQPMQGPHEPNLSQHEPAQPHPVNGHAYGYGRYVPSPLPRWAATPKRHEYFSGEYRYYPTPVREGIYSIATDANRLTTMFSEENPNACTIA
ncbi:Groundhog protein 7 [Rhynchospora pubera]|uniref:Groundhog protein 7 n=1 Tax=Rhynchospora pubera TaxID=906938 RepID=A0AAV8DVV8_9POAL|nr:Groundhog protein 7 [Rhynchospora pubera]